MKTVILIFFILFGLQLQAQVQGETVPLKLYEKLQKEKEDLEIELKSSKTSNTALTAEVNKHKKELEILTIYKSNTVKTIETQNKQITDLQKQLDVIKTSTNQNLNTKIVELRKGTVDKTKEITKLNNDIKGLNDKIKSIRNNSSSKQIKKLQADLSKARGTYQDRLSTKNQEIKTLKSKIKAFGDIKSLVAGLSVSTEDEVARFNNEIETFLKNTGTALNNQPLDKHLEIIDELDEEATAYISFLGEEYKDVKNNLKQTQLKLRNYKNALDLIEQYKNQLNKPYNAAKITTLLNKETTVLKEIPSETNTAKQVIIERLNSHKRQLQKYCTAHNEVYEAFEKIIDAFAIDIKTSTLTQIESKFQSYPYLLNIIKTKRPAFLSEMIDKNPLPKVSCK